MLLPLGLLSWLLVGLFIGLGAAWTLPKVFRSGWVLPTLWGVSGATLGGMLATFLGFGGLVGYDVRGLLTATLAAALTVALGYVFKLRQPAD